LASIKGARSSEAVNELFQVIKKAIPDAQGPVGFDMGENAVSIHDLRSDEPASCDADQKELIRKNFPVEKDGFLVVPKVIEE
jgi:Asp-tRNA(Asn)/Glu-tRNA(Gln) amidotransferase C subunit